MTVGTIFEGSHIPLNKWLLAFYLLCSSKKGMSAHQLHRMLGITYKTAWFMAHRIRYAMEQPAFSQAAQRALSRPTRPTSAARSALEQGQYAPIDPCSPTSAGRPDAARTRPLW